MNPIPRIIPRPRPRRQPRGTRPKRELYTRGLSAFFFARRQASICDSPAGSSSLTVSSSTMKSSSSSPPTSPRDLPESGRRPALPVCPPLPFATVVMVVAEAEAGRDKAVAAMTSLALASPKRSTSCDLPPGPMDHTSVCNNPRAHAPNVAQLDSFFFFCDARSAVLLVSFKFFPALHEGSSSRLPCPGRRHGRRPPPPTRPRRASRSRAHLKSSFSSVWMLSLLACM